MAQTAGSEKPFISRTFQLKLRFLRGVWNLLFSTQVFNSSLPLIIKKKTFRGISHREAAELCGHQSSEAPLGLSREQCEALPGPEIENTGEQYFNSIH